MRGPVPPDRHGGWYAPGGMTGPAGPQGPPGGTAQTYWFHDDPSDIIVPNQYFKLLPAPANGAESDDSVSVTLGTSPLFIEAYATEPGSPNALEIPAGNWTFDFWRFQTGGAAGNQHVVFDVYKRNPAGVETLLFTVTSADITENVVTREILTIAEPAFTLAQTDRLVVKVYATNSVAGARVVHFVHDGQLHASFVTIPATPQASILRGTRAQRLAYTSTVDQVGSLWFETDTEEWWGLRVAGTPTDARWYRVLTAWNGETLATVDLPTDALTAVLVETFPKLAFNATYQALLGVRVDVYLDATPATNASIDIAVCCVVTTNGAGVPTFAFQSVPVPDVSLLPAGLFGTTATVAASAQGFTISATRPAGVHIRANAEWWIERLRRIV